MVKHLSCSWRMSFVESRMHSPPLQSWASRSRILSGAIALPGPILQTPVPLPTAEILASLQCSPGGLGCPTCCSLGYQLLLKALWEILIIILKICFVVREKIGPIATPDYIQHAPGLPKTRSGKESRFTLVRYTIWEQAAQLLVSASWAAPEEGSHRSAPRAISSPG